MKSTILAVLLGHLALVGLAMLPSSSWAAEDCRTGWEYRVVDLSDPDGFRKKGKSRLAASNGLVSTLNRLGGVGWEIVSNHSVSISKEMSQLPGAAVDTKPRDWVAELTPSTALLRRQTEICN